MNGSSVSQAAAVALRQLQSQLASAYADNAKLQVRGAHSLQLITQFWRI